MATSSSTTHDGYIFICECDEWMRGACLREIFYKEHDGKRYCVLHYPGKEKSEEFKKALRRKLDDKDFDFKGVWFPDEVSFRDLTFSANADFSGARFSADADFSGAQFSVDADFRSAQFGANVNFRGAKFKAVTTFMRTQFCMDAYFSYAHFGAIANFFRARFSAVADFGSAQFSADANFRGAHFGAAAYFDRVKISAVAYFLDAQFGADVDFSYAHFGAAAYFSYAQFGADANLNGAQFIADAYFNNVVFNANVYLQKTMFLEDSPQDISAKGNNQPINSNDKDRVKAKTLRISFDEASFKDGISFNENQFAGHVLLSFSAAVFEKPERVTFHTVSLRPHWFINVDPRKFNLVRVNWGFLNKLGAVRNEINALEKGKVGYLRPLLEIAFRQLAVNAEENDRYEEAADFRYMAMDFKRLGRSRKVDLFRLSWWYWLLSDYGEGVQRAFIMLLAIWLLFAIIYWSSNATWWQPRQTGRIVSESSQRDTQQSTVAMPLTFPEALVYSGGVMALQKPEPLPANKRAKTFVLLETILGPVQAALLALAIRRKFMR